MPPPRIPFAKPLSHLRILRSSFQLPPFLRTHTYSNDGLTNHKSRTVLGMAVLFGKLFLTLHLINKYLFSISPTNGISMLPTIPHSYRLTAPRILISKLHRRGRDLHVGDVIVYTSPMLANSQACKRIVGMPGDPISIYTPGKRESDLESEEDGFAEVKEEMIRVPEGHCWVAGDNLDWSRDSRVFGPVPLALVKGKVVALLWPWREARWFGNGLTHVIDEEKEWVVAR